MVTPTFLLSILGAALCLAVVAAVLLARWRFSMAGMLGYGLDFLFLLPLVLPPGLISNLFDFFARLFNFNAHWLDVHPWAHVAFAAMALSLLPFPILYLAARVAFSRVGDNLLDAARTLGMGEWSILWRVMVRQGWLWLAGGFVLGVGRVVAEFNVHGLLASAISAILCFGLLLQLPKRSACA